MIKRLLGSTKGLKSWLILLLTVLVIESALTIYIPNFREYFYDIIQSKLINQWTSGLILFICLTGGLVIIQTFKIFVKQRLGLNLRDALQSNLIYIYRFSLYGATYDAKAQRIHEDSKLATDYYLTVITEIFISAVIVVGLLITAYTMHNIIIAATLYTAGCIVTGLLFHKRLINTEIGVQKEEATYRSQLEKGLLTEDTKNHFSVEVYNVIIKQLNTVLGFKMLSNLQTGLVSLVPFLILVPQYFNNSLSFGAVMAGVAVFDLLVINASILIMYYTEYTKALASWERIKEFYEVLK